MRLRMVLYLLVCCLLFTECKKPGCFGKSGSMVSLKKQMASFKQIDLFNNINLILTQGTEEVIEIEAGSNAQPNISAIVENEILTLRNNGTCDWLQDPEEKINVYVTFKKLEKLQYNGSGNVTSTAPVIADNFTIYSEEGAGNIELHLLAKNTNIHLQGENPDVILHGKSETCHTFVHSRGTIDFSDFSVRDLNISYTSVRDAVINVTNKINAIIFHTGNLYYQVEPAHIEANYFSTGRVLKKP